MVPCYSTVSKPRLCITITLFCAIIVSSCGRSGDSIAKIVEERDSLRSEMRIKQRQLSNIDTLVSILNNGIDSIAAAQGTLFISNHREGTPTKSEMLSKVSMLSEIIENQKSKIAQLESDLQHAQETEGLNPDPGVNALLAHVKLQLAQKDKEIANLKIQLQKKDVDIANLRQQIGSQSQTIAELNRRAEIQNEALKRQDAMLNQCYMIVASKKVLEQKGIVKKGKIVPQAALDRSKFAKVDIRQFTQFSFDSKRPKILTSMPSGSYKLTTNGKGKFTMTITDPNAFWSVSNYLVIQTN